MTCKSGALTASEYSQTLAAKLVPCVDKIRQLNTNFGLRPYRVFLVITEWTGQRRGQGVERVLSETELLPTPKIESFASLNLQLMSAGLEEVGDLRISEISPKYTGEQLLGRHTDNTELLKNQGFRWEVVLYKQGNEPIRRSFVPKGLPDFMPGRVQWAVSLTRLRSGVDRDSEGRP